jgi:hypothetical protein
MSKPNWLSNYTNEIVHYGFDEKGMWFSGNADGTSYPVRTNFDIPQDTTTTVIFTFTHNSFCSDQGICVFNADVEPMWVWGSDSSRIACSMNCNSPQILGLSDSVGDIFMEESGPLEIYQTYTGVFVYNPTESLCNFDLYVGGHTAIENTDPIYSLEFSDHLPDGNYRVGFSADSDGVGGGEDQYGPKSYFSWISINGQEADLTAYLCSREMCDNASFFCKLDNTNKNCSCRTWKLYKSAYVPAITVCTQRLF